MDGLQPLIDFVHRHPRLLVITGAGCSKAAGIPDYRYEHGAWKRREPMHYQLFRTVSMHANATGRTAG